MRRDERLAGADVAEQQPVGGSRRREIGQYLAGGADLVGGELEWDGAAQCGECGAVERVGESGVLAGE